MNSSQGTILWLCLHSIAVFATSPYAGERNSIVLGVSSSFHSSPIMAVASSLRKVVNSTIVRQLDDLAYDQGQSHSTVPEIKAETVLLSLVLLLFTLVVIFTLLSFREWIWVYHGIPCCRKVNRRENTNNGGNGNNATANRNEQADVPRNGSLEEDANESFDADEEPEDRANRILAQRVRRRSWYEYYMKTSTRVVTEEDIVDNDNNDNASGTGQEGESTAATASACDTCDSTKSLMVKLDESKGRLVDGSCAICICEYEVGDKIVVSPLEDCSHVFHEDCM